MKQLKMAVVCFLCVVTAGITGFVSIEHLSWLDAVYLTLTTITTVGYGDITPATAAGKLFTILLMICGVGTAGYTFTLIISNIIEGHIKNLFGRRAMQKKMANLNQHVIVCGAGRVGQQVIAGLKNSGQPFIVIEFDPEIVDALLADDILAICGDAKSDNVLQTAGVKKATTLVAALSDDADNVYVTLSAKSQNQDIIIAARASKGEAESKLKQAGATTVISPSISGGRQILAAITHPLAYDFFQNMFYNEKLYINMAEIRIGDKSELAGKTLSDFLAESMLNLSIVAINRNLTFLYNSLEKETITTGDILIAIGQRASIEELTQLAGSTQKQNPLNQVLPI